MKKRTIGGIVAIGVLLLSTVSNSSNPQNVELDSSVAPQVNSVTENTPKVQPICDGTAIKSNCTVDGIAYSKYIYHPAVPEKTRTESTTTYKDEVSGYCTLCRDGTYSPSCATGRGACSHHGGVAQWNAPRYRRVPVDETKTVVEAPAVEAYFEKVIE